MNWGDIIMFWIDPLILLGGIITFFLVFSWVLEKFADFIGYTDE